MNDDIVNKYNQIAQNAAMGIPAPAEPKVRGRGGFATSLISEGGGLGGALGGAAIGSAILPGPGTIAGGIIGGFLGGFGGSALEQQIRDDEIRIEEALGEGLFSGAFGGLGAVGQASKAVATTTKGAAGIAKGATAAKGASGATKAGAAVKAAAKPNLLQRMAQTQTERVVMPKVTASPFAAVDKAQIANVMKDVPGLSARAKLNNLPGYFNNLSGQIDDIVKGATQTTTKNSVFSTIKTKAVDLPQFVGTDKTYQNALKVELQNLGTQLGKGPVTASQVFRTKQALSSKMTNIFSKLEKGADLNPKEASRLAIWGSLDDTVTKLAPGSKELLGVQSTLYKAAPGVLRASEKAFGIPILGIQSQSAMQGVQAGRTLAGKAAGAAGNLQAATLGRVPSIPKVMLPAYAVQSAFNAQPAPSTLEDALSQGTYGGEVPSGVSQVDQTIGQAEQQMASPYGRLNLLYDIQRDPTNASDYIKYYQAINTIFTPETSKLTATQQKLAASAQNALQDVPMVLQAIESGKIGGARMIPGSQTPIGRRLLGTEDLDAALFNIADNILRARTGAAAPEAEIRRFMESFLPNPYDSQEAQVRKLDRAVRELQSFIQPQAASAGTLEELLMQQQGGY